MLNTPQLPTPLGLILQDLATHQRRAEFAALSGTTVGYLYQLAGCHNKQCRSGLAQRISDASKVMRKKYKSPAISVRELACMCQIPGG